MDPNPPPLPKTRSSPLPWALLLLVMAGAGALIYYGLQMLQKAQDSADRAVTSRDESLKSLKKLEDEKAELVAKTNQAVADRDDAAAKIDALKTNLHET